MKPLLLILSLVHGADGATTLMGLHAGAREANPLMPQTAGVNLAVNAGGTLAGIYGLSKLHTTHPKLAKGIAWVLIGAEAGIVASNVRVIQMQRGMR